MLQDGERPHRILIVSPGSQGDVDPFLAIAARLLGAGHQVTIATAYRYAHLVEATGARFAPAELAEFADQGDELLDEIFRSPARGAPGGATRTVCGRAVIAATDAIGPSRVTSAVR